MALVSGGDNRYNARMFEELQALVADAESVFLTATVGLDPDAVGAIVALRAILLHRRPELRVYIDTDEAVPVGHQFMHAGIPWGETPPGPVDLAFVVDGGAERVGSVEPIFAAARRRVQIDHHVSSDGRGVDLALLDGAAASTTELLLDLADEWQVPLDHDLAQAIYAGMVFDTGGFRYRLVSPRTLRGAARLLEQGIDHAAIVERVLLEQSEARLRLRARMIETLQVGGGVASAVIAQTGGVETGGLVDDLVFLEGVEVGVLVTAKGAGRAKVSLRSRGGVNVSEVAKTLAPTGGGHARASGATVEGSVEAVREKVLQALGQAQPPK